MSLVKPVAPMVFPSDLSGEVNGAVNPVLLTQSGCPSGYPPFLYSEMHHLASRAMKAMLAAAKVDLPTHDIRNVGTGRTLAQQIQLFDGTDPRTWNGANGRYVPQTMWLTYEQSGRKWASPADIRSWKGMSWKRRGGTAAAAVPGTSNHGWWLAIDFSEEYDGNPFTVEGITVEFTKWLINNAMRFGYSAETQSEDWHWRYVAGDNVPQAVLDYENPPTPIPPTPPVYDEDMPTLYRDSRYNNAFLVNGDVTTVGPLLYQSYIDRGTPVVVDTHDQSLFSFMRKAQLKTGQMVANGTGTPPAFPPDLIGS